MNNIKNNKHLVSGHVVSVQHAGKQQGAILLWSIVFLVVVTLLGVSAVRMSGIDTQVAGNSMAAMLTYQGVESALGKVASSDDMSNIEKASKVVNKNGWKVPATYLPAENVSGGAKMNSTAMVKYEEKHPCPLNMGAISTSFQCEIFRIDATARLSGSAAKARHVIGIALPEAKATNP